MYTQKQIDRFWSNVEVGTPDACWPWQRSRTSNGYGQVGLLVNGRSRILKAHKVAWEIHNGDKLMPHTRARHSCGNRLCCNPHHVVVQPDHLLGRGFLPHTQGESHGMAKLTDKQVRLIKYRLNLLSTREIADTFSMSYHTIWDIRKGITWKHI